MLGDRESFIGFGGYEMRGEKDLSSLSLSKRKSRKFLCGYVVREGKFHETEIEVSVSLVIDTNF